MRTDGNGGRTPEEIQAQIDRTRRELDGTLSAIEDRLTPGQLVDQGLSYLRHSGGAEFVSNLGEQAKQNPMPLALVGIGLAWLMATGKTGPMLRAEPASGPSLGERAAQARARLGETATSMRDSAASVRDSARQQMDRARSGMDTMMREQPLALGAVGLAIGALAAALAPRTQREARIAEKIDAAANPTAGQEGTAPYAERAQSEAPPV